MEREWLGPPVSYPSVSSHTKNSRLTHHLETGNDRYSRTVPPHGRFRSDRYGYEDPLPPSSTQTLNANSALGARPRKSRFDVDEFGRKTRGPARVWERNNDESFRRTGREREESERSEVILPTARSAVVVNQSQNQTQNQSHYGEYDHGRKAVEEPPPNSKPRRKSRFDVLPSEVSHRTNTTTTTTTNTVINDDNHNNNNNNNHNVNDHYNNVREVAPVPYRYKAESEGEYLRQPPHQHHQQHHRDHHHKNSISVRRTGKVEERYSRDESIYSHSHSHSRTHAHAHADDTPTIDIVPHPGERSGYTSRWGIPHVENLKLELTCLNGILTFERH